jgi:hypothetical protein
MRDRDGNEDQSPVFDAIRVDALIYHIDAAPAGNQRARV